MDRWVPVILSIAWLAIAALLVWGVVNGLRRVLLNNAPLPFFGMLERQGVTLAQAEQAVGINELSHAVRRCALCAGRSGCVPPAPYCQNETILQRLRSLVP